MYEASDTELNKVNYPIFTMSETWLLLFNKA